MSMDLTIVLSVLGSVIVIVGGIIGMMMKRKLFRLQVKSERTRARYYNSRKKAEDMREVKEFVDTGKKIWDWFTGKNDPYQNLRK